MSTLTLSAAALIGAFMVMLIVIAVASKVRDVITLLVIGLMTGYVASALSSFLIAFAQAQDVQFDGQDGRPLLLLRVGEQGVHVLA